MMNQDAMSLKIDKTPAGGYSDPALAKSGAGIGLPQSERTQALIRSVFFVPVLWRASWGVFGRAGSSDPVGQPVASVTLLFGLNGDGSLNSSEETVMSYSSRTDWYTCENAPRGVEDLPFVRREGAARINWWAVTPPLSRYSQPHEALGRAYGYEFLDLLNNPRRNEPFLPKHMLGYIAMGILRQYGEGVPEGMARGFFDVISEYVVAGEVDR